MNSPMVACTKQRTSAPRPPGRENPSVVNDEPLVMIASRHGATPNAQYMGTNEISTISAHAAGQDEQCHRGVAGHDPVVALVGARASAGELEPFTQRSRTPCD